MGSNLRNFQPVYLKLLEDMERLSRAVDPSYLAAYEQIERALEPIRQQHLELAEYIKIAGLTSLPLAGIVQANERWQHLIDQATASAHVFQNLQYAHPTWLDKITSMQDSTAHLQAAAKLSLGHMAYSLTVTEGLLAGIDFEALRRVAELPEPAFPKFDSIFGDVLSTYGRLADSIRTFPDLARLPAFALPGATRELFVTGYALDAISIRDKPARERDASEVQLIAEVEQETSGCIALLQSVDPALARPYVGAHDALQGRNVDRARHILSSLRELWNHLLRRLAPDESVLAWVPTDDKDLLHEGLPTRRARVLYVCRSLNHEPLTDLVVQDTSSLVRLVQLFDRVHELEMELTDEQLRALLLRTDSWLLYILQIREGGQRP